MKRAIVFPGGGAGNHLRWLLYLDNSIDGDKTIDEKVDFITNSVYSNERSYNNWLSHEAKWRYDDKYESFIKILHEPKDDIPTSKSLFITYQNWNTALNHYSCFTNFFSSEHYYEEYYKFLLSFDDKLRTYVTATNNKLIIQADNLFLDELDKNIYNNIIEFFGFADKYYHAAIVHKKWNEARKKANKEFYDFYTSRFWQQCVDKIRINAGVHIDRGSLP